MHSSMRYFIPFILTAALFCNAGPSMSQSGGRSAYSFLNLMVSPRAAAMGMGNVYAKDNDLNLAVANPALITQGMDGNLSLSFADYYAGISYGYAAYSHTFEKFGSFTGSMIYLNYGTFTYADPTGLTAGNFTAGDYAFQLGWGRALDSLFSLGANLKFIHSGLESYTSFGLATDVAVAYHHPDQQLSVSFQARNIGRQLKAYVPGSPEPLPFELQLGVSKKLRHVPLRYHVLLTNLQRWNLRYTDPSKPTTDPLTGEPISENEIENFLDNAMRHVVFGAELSPGNALSLRLGYNYLRRQEMKVSSRLSTVGFTWGIGLKISRFHFNYARAAFHLAGSPNYLSVTTNLQDFWQRH